MERKVKFNQKSYPSNYRFCKITLNVCAIVNTGITSDSLLDYPFYKRKKKKKKEFYIPEDIALELK